MAAGSEESLIGGESREPLAGACGALTSLFRS
jgi:hypothetical protein